jgi:cytochrome c-type biogenesis protein CcmE
MTHRYIKLGITSAVLVAAFGGLLWSTLRQGTEYFMDVNEVMPNRQAWEGKPLRLHGYVVPGSILVKRDSLEYRFKIQNSPPRANQPGESMVDVSYTGIVPDTFKDEAEVTLQGQLSPAGFHTDPNGVTAKCPSKYESAGKSASGAPAGS